MSHFGMETIGPAVRVIGYLNPSSNPIPLPTLARCPGLKFFNRMERSHRDESSWMLSRSS